MIYVMVMYLRLCDDAGVCRPVAVYDSPVATLAQCERLKARELERLKPYHPEPVCEAMKLPVALEVK